MQWAIGYELEFFLIVIYIKYWSVVDSLQWDVESTLKLDSKGTSTPIGPNSPLSELINLDGPNYKGWISFMFTLVYKGILVIMYGCIVNKVSRLG